MDETEKSGKMVKLRGKKKSKFTRGTTRAATLKAIAHVDADWTSETSQYNKENKSCCFCFSLFLVARCQKHFMTFR